MPVAIALILGAVTIAVCLIGFIWMVIVLLPFYAWVAAAAYFMWRSKRAEDALTATARQEADLRRQLNDQEIRAWHASINAERRNER
jgi:flagellar basal body-associated protein FliL